MSFTVVKPSTPRRLWESTPSNVQYKNIVVITFYYKVYKERLIKQKKTQLKWT